MFLDQLPDIGEPGINGNGDYDDALEEDDEVRAPGEEDQECDLEIDEEVESEMMENGSQGGNPELHRTSDGRKGDRTSKSDGTRLVSIQGRSKEDP